MLQNKIVRGLACLLLAAMLLGALPVQTQASTFNVRVTSSYTYIYQSASTSSTALKRVAKNEILLCGLVTGSWAYVKYSGVKGFVKLSDVTTEAAATPSPSPSPSSPKSTSNITAVTTEKLRLYKSPSLTAAYYGTIGKGKSLTCFKVSGIWAYVQVGSYKGYVLKAGLASKSASTGSSSGSPAATAAPKPTASPKPTAATGNESGITCYIKSSVSLYTTASTQSAAICQLKAGDKIIVTHVKSGWARVITSAKRVGYVPSSYVSKTKVAAIGKVIMADWFTSNIQNIFAVGMDVLVTDVLTRKTFKIHRRGGLYHADVEPLTKADTAAILALYGGHTSWDRRPIWITINGVSYAASMNFMNHGDQTITTNGFKGHFCIHFLNSRTHGTNKVDPEHQAAVRAAYAARP